MMQLCQFNPVYCLVVERFRTWADKKRYFSTIRTDEGEGVEKKFCRKNSSFNGLAVIRERGLTHSGEISLYSTSTMGCFRDHKYLKTFFRDLWVQ